MEKKNFWNDAAKYGAMIGLAGIVFAVVEMYWKNGILGFLSFVVFITLLYIFTKRRAMRYGGGEKGYSYGQCLWFIFCMMLFAGILEGAYHIIASNWLFAARYDQMMDQSLAMFESTGIYSRNQMDMMVDMGRRMLHSPIYLVLSSMLGSVIKGVFFGLIVSIFTRRVPSVFTGDNQ